MNRRKLIAMLGGATAAWPLRASAQQTALPTIGFLCGTGRGDVDKPFYDGLAQAGFIDGRNVAIEYQVANMHFDLLPSMAMELVRRRVSVIYAHEPPSAFAAKAATHTIPIVFHSGGDPVASGLVSSLARPGGNLTGVTAFATALTAKRLGLLCELLPAVRVVGMLVNPGNPNANPTIDEAEKAARLRTSTCMWNGPQGLRRPRSP